MTIRASAPAPGDCTCGRWPRAGASASLDTGEHRTVSLPAVCPRCGDDEHSATPCLDIAELATKWYFGYQLRAAVAARMEAARKEGREAFAWTLAAGDMSEYARVIAEAARRDQKAKDAAICDDVADAWLRTGDVRDCREIKRRIEAQS